MSTCRLETESLVYSKINRESLNSTQYIAVDKTVTHSTVYNVHVDYHAFGTHCLGKSRNLTWRILEIDMLLTDMIHACMPIWNEVV